MKKHLLCCTLVLLSTLGSLTAVPVELLQISKTHSFRTFSYPYGLSGTDLIAAQSLFLYAYALHEDPDIELAPGEKALDIQLIRLRRLLANEPSCVGGIYGWNDGRIAHSFLLARRTPAIWDALSADEQEKADWLMRALAIAGHFCMDDGNNYHQMLDGGGNFAKGWNPNHIEGYVGAVIAASLYFGADALNTIFHEFDFDTYMDKFTELGFSNIKAAWQRIPETKALMMTGGTSIASEEVDPNWGGSEGSGAGVRNDFTYQGEPLDNLFGIYYHLGNRMFNHTVVSTVENPGGTEIKILGEATGATISPYEGQEGMMYEFLSSDANGLRSDAHYCFDGLVNNVPNRVIVQLFAGWPDSSQGDDLRSRTEVGVGDFVFKVTEGYQGYQKGHMNTVRKSDLGVSYDSVLAVFNEMVEFAPDFTAPAAPQSLRVEQIGEKVSVQWTDAADNETGFEVYRSVGKGDWIKVSSLPADATSFTDVSPRPGERNAYRVRALIGEIPSMMSNSGQVFIPDLQSDIIELFPSDDSYVRYGVYGDDTNGAGDALQIKDAWGADFKRVSILKFNLEGIEGRVHQAVLRLYTSSYAESSLALTGTSDDSWTEEQVTANTMPEWGDVLAHFDVVDGENQIDLTDPVNAELSDDGALSLILHDEDNADVFVTFFSSESSHPPELILQMAARADYLVPALDGTFVQGGESADENNGSNANLIVKDAGGPDFDRSSLLKFSLEGFVGKDVTSAILNLNVSIFAEASLVLRSIADDNWSEDTVTLNTAPEFGEVITRFDLVEGSNSIDLTDVVIAELAGDATLSLVIQDEDDANVFVAFHSDDSANPPQLALTVFEDPVILPWGDIRMRPGDRVIDVMFGQFEVSEGGWLHHAELGWINVTGISYVSNMWIYSQILGAWVWTNDTLFPIVYDTGTGRWVYYFYLEDIGGWMYDYSSGIWTRL